MSAFAVREATPEDAPGILRLFAKAFGTVMTQEEWTWKFQSNPDGWLGLVAVSDGEIVGNFAGWGMRFLVSGQPRLVYALGDLATDPRVRSLGKGRNVYSELSRAFYETARARGAPFTIGFPSTRSETISNRLAGTETYFPIRETRVPCEAFPAPPEDTGAGDFVGESFDPLWTAAARRLRDSPVRDRGRVNWRFHARPNRYYRMIWRRAGEADRSWAVLSVTGEDALVADFLVGDEGAAELPALFATAAAEARRLGARQLVFWETPGGPVRRALAGLPGARREAGFSMIGKIYEPEIARPFLGGGHIPPALYDVV